MHTRQTARLGRRSRHDRADGRPARADLANLCNEAAIFAGRSSAQYIRQVDFDAAMDRIVGGRQRRGLEKKRSSRTTRPARGDVPLVGDPSGTEGTTALRGQALGYTLNTPAEDRYMHTREEFLDLMKVFLVGRAAEEVVFGRITNGAANDLERVTEIARSMVFEFGMSEVAPSRTMRADNYALSETKRLRDSEQARLTDHAYEEAKRLLLKHRATLDRGCGSAPGEGDARPLRTRGAARGRRA